MKKNWKALLPIGVFLVMYLGLGILFEYVLKIPMGFYNIPIVVSFPYRSFLLPVYRILNSALMRNCRSWREV